MVKYLVPIVRVASLVIIGTPLAADTVDLSTGGTIDGRTIRRTGHLIVEVDPGLQIALRDRADGGGATVTSITDSDALAEYRTLREAAGDDAEKNYQLAIWCRVRGNIPGKTKEYRDFHLKRAIAADPEHARARGALTYKKIDGRWILQSELMEERGMIRRAGSWEMPEAVAAMDRAEQAERIAKQWIRDLPRHIKMIERQTAKAGEAWEFLSSIDDPLASVAIADRLKRGREGDAVSRRNLRMLWVKKLAQFKTGPATAALVAAGLDDPDQVVREAALDALATYPFGASSAVATYLPMLKANDHRLINAAARALSWFPDPELAETYLESLVTDQKTVQAAGPGMNAAFGGNGTGNNGGMGGLSTGGGPTTRIQTRHNPAVLALLRLVEPDVNHSYDEQAWREYFAAKKNAYRGDLRRDP